MIHDPCRRGGLGVFAIALSLGVLITGRPMAKAGLPPNVEQKPRSVHAKRIDFGTLYAGAVAEAEFSVRLLESVARGLEVRVETPEFADLKSVRVFKRAMTGAPESVNCIGIITIDARLPGKRAGDLQGLPQRPRRDDPHRCHGAASRARADEGAGRLQWIWLNQ